MIERPAALVLDHKEDPVASTLDRDSPARVWARWLLGVAELTD